MVASHHKLAMSSSVQDHIKDCIDFYAYDDALFLAEANYEKEKTEEALLVLSDCQYRTGRLDELYVNLREHTFINPRLRFIFAKCCFQLNKLEDCERTLTGDQFVDYGLHPTLTNSTAAAFSYNILSKVSSYTGRQEVGRRCASLAISVNPLHWSSIQEYLHLGGTDAQNLFANALKGVQSSSSSARDIERNSGEVETYKEETPTSMLPPRGPLAAPRKPAKRATATAETRRSARLVANDEENADAGLPVSRVRGAAGAGSGAAASRVPSRADALSRSPKRKAESRPLASRNSNAAAAASSRSKSWCRLKGAPSLASSSTPSPSPESSLSSSTSNMLSTFSSLALVHEAICQFQLSSASRLLDSLSSSPHVSVLRARVLIERGEYASARTVLEEYRRAHPFRVEGLEMLSTALWQLQDSHALSALAHTLTSQCKHRPESWCAAANCFSLAKQHAKAVECLERAIRLDPRFVYSYTLLGCELLELEELDGAMRAFRAALAVRPADYRAWYGLAMVHQRREQLPLAKINLEKAIAINGENAVLLCSLATVQQAMGCSELALRTLDMAVEKEPSSVACLYHRARLLYDLRHYEECIDTLNHLKRLAPDEANVFFLLGRVHKRRGETHLALLHFNWASAMDPRGEKMLSDLGEPLDDDCISPL